MYSSISWLVVFLVEVDAPSSEGDVAFFGAEEVEPRSYSASLRLRVAISEFSESLWWMLLWSLLRLGGVVLPSYLRLFPVRLVWRRRLVELEFRLGRRRLVLLEVLLDGCDLLVSISL